FAPMVHGAPAAGGMATHIAGFTAGTHAAGHKLRFISSGSIDLPADVPIDIIAPSAALGATRALFELWNNMLFTVGATRLAGEPSHIADFIYQRYSRFNWTGVVLSLITGLPLALEFNGSEVWVARHWDPVGCLGLLRQFEKLNLLAADLI